MKRLIAGAGLAAGIAAIALALAAARIARQSTLDEAQEADAIVVLGAAEYRGRPSPVLRARLDHALKLYRRGLAPRILTTGGSGAQSRFTEAEAARDYLVTKGVPSEAILVEPHGTSTLQSIAAAAEMLHQRNLSRCIVVSDGYHIFRAKRMFEAHGITVYGSPRQSSGTTAWRENWRYLRQAAGYWLWRLNLAR